MRRIREDDLPPAEKDRMTQEVRDVIEYATNIVDCRRSLLLARFGEPFDPAQCNRTCDNCQYDGQQALPAAEALPGSSHQTSSSHVDDEELLQLVANIFAESNDHMQQVSDMWQLRGAKVS